MSKKEIKNEWKQYLLDEDKEYVLSDLLQNFKKAVDFLRNKGVRISKMSLLKTEDFDKEFHLSEDDKLYYLQRFINKGYSKHDSEIIITVMDALYHMLDITKEEAEKFTEYIAEKHMTLSDAISEKYEISLDEINEYMEVVLGSYLRYCIKRSLQYGKELIDILTEVFSGE